MRTVLQRVLLVLLFVLTLPPVLAAASHSFNVIVKDRNGNPVPGVTLSVLSGGKKFIPAVTDANGGHSISLPESFQDNADVRVVVRKCRRENGMTTTEILFLQPGAPLPPQENCDDYPAGFFLPPDHDGAVVTVNDVDTPMPTVAIEAGARTAGGGAAPPRFKPMPAWGPTVSGFGGASFIKDGSGHSNALPLIGGDFGINYRLSHGFDIEPFAGIRWAKSMEIQKLSGTGGTSATVYAGTTSIPIGVRVGLPEIGGLRISAEGGAVPTFTRQRLVETFCATPSM